MRTFRVVEEGLEKRMVEKHGRSNCYLCFSADKGGVLEVQTWSIIQGHRGLSSSFSDQESPQVLARKWKRLFPTKLETEVSITNTYLHAKIDMGTNQDPVTSRKMVMISTKDKEQLIRSVDKGGELKGKNKQSSIISVLKKRPELPSRLHLVKLNRSLNRTTIASQHKTKMNSGARPLGFQ